MWEFNAERVAEVQLCAVRMDLGVHSMGSIAASGTSDEESAPQSSVSLLDPLPTEVPCPP